MPNLKVDRTTLLQPKRAVWLSCLLALLLFSGPAVSAEISATLSRNPISIDESFQLILESDSATDGDPDFSVLERDFRIVSQSQSQNIRMINGKVSRSTTWNLTLLAQQTGRLTIPAVAFGSDSSKPLTIMVKRAAPPQQGLSGDDIFLKVEAKPMQAYPAAQILLNVQLYRAVSTDNASLSPPESDDPDLLVKKLGEDEQYETNIGGRRYLVVERRYALFTQKNGALNLAPLVFQGEVLKPGSRRDNLFGSPFGRFGAPGEIRRIQSNPISITIEPAPSLAAGEPWLPSSNLQLVENWGGENRQFTVGEPVTRTLMLFADGLTSAQLPELKITLPEGLKQYPDQPVLHDRESKEGITGIRQVKIAIVPSRSGSFTLPAIKLDWWNTTERRMETASIAEQQIEVLPAPAGETHSAEPKAPVALQPQQLTAPNLSTAGNTATAWPESLTIFLGLGWLVTAITWWYSAHRGRRTQSETAPTADRTGKTGLRALRAACLANDPEAGGKALLEWGRLRWPDAPPRTLGSIAERAINIELKKQIAELERALYAAAPLPWQGAALLTQLETERRTKSTDSQPEEAIAPLHPG